MISKGQTQKSGTTKQTAPKEQVVQPHPGEHFKPKPKVNKDANPAGQGNEGDDVMMAGRETGG